MARGMGSPMRVRREGIEWRDRRGKQLLDLPLVSTTNPNGGTYKVYLSEQALAHPPAARN